MTRTWTLEQEELLKLGADGRPLLRRVAVAADAGAGKTSVLVERVKRLGEGRRILCVSFTEKSKADLEQKLSDWISTEVYTIHGFCSRVVSEFGGQLGLPPFFRILDADERDEILYRCFEKVYRRKPPANVEHKVDGFWWLCRMAAEVGNGFKVHEPLEAGTQKFVGEVLEEFEASKKLLRALEYSDLERVATRLLNKPEVSETLRSRYFHLFVDEFQDTSELQCELVHQLVGRDGLVFVVGDKKQSIYRFRGADVRVFGEFVATLPDNRRLSWNFRSDPAVIEAVNAVCAPVIEDYQPMTAARPADRSELPASVFEKIPRVARVTCADDAEGIAAIVGRLRFEGVEWAQIVLLLRRVKGNDELFAELASRGIAVAVTSASSASANEDLQKLLNLWIWACEPFQRLRAARVGTDFFPERRATLDQVLLELKSPLEEAEGLGEQWSCERLLARLCQRFGLRQRFGAVFEQFELFVLRHQSEGLLPGALARRLQHLLANSQDISGFVLLPPPANLAGTIRGLTIHGAKGLEFPVVILADVKDRRKRSSGILRRGSDIWLPGRDEKGDLDWSAPEMQNAKAFEEEAEQAESARLLYVAMTRAQESLYIVDRPEVVIEGAEAKKKQAKKTDASWAAWLKAGIAQVVGAEVFAEKQFVEPRRPAIEATRSLSRALAMQPPVYSKARVGVTELGARLGLAAEHHSSHSGPKPATKPRTPRLSPEQARDLGIEIHAHLEHEDWPALRAAAARSKLDLALFWQWLETLEGQSVFQKFERVFPEFAFEWRSEHGTVTGRMDRLVLVGGEAWIVDYKILLTPRSREDLFAAYSNQLGIYGDAVKSLTKLPSVRTFLLDVAASSGAVWHEVLASRP